MDFGQIGIRLHLFNKGSIYRVPTRCWALYFFFKPAFPPLYISPTFLWAAEDGACKCLQLPHGYLRFPLSLLQLPWMSEPIGLKYEIHKPRLNRRGEDC